MKFIAIIGLVLIFSIISCKQVPETPTPNIVLIFVDDLGYEDLGCYGQELIRTPHLDQMAAEGMRFTNFYTASPVCAPSRCSLMMGKHAGHSAIRSNMNTLPLGQIPIRDEEITMAELLKEKGYRTGAMGKWSLGSPYNSGDPLKQGFDHFFGYYCQCMAHNYYPEAIWRNKDKIQLRNEIVPVEVEWCPYPLSYSSKKIDYSAEFVIEEALRFIDKNKKDPFFLYLPITLPHSNGEAPPDERFEVPDWGVYKNKQWSPVEKGYASMVTMLDEHAGAVMKRLQQHSIAENTLVIFTSDNGPTKFAKIFYESTNLRGRKRDLYENGIKVPMIAWWPGKIPAGVVSDYPAVTYDLLSTFCDAANVNPPEDSDGISILPVLFNEKQPTREFLYWEIYEGDRNPKQAVRQGEWKLIRFLMDSETEQELELYNLNNDPQETANLIDQYPEKVSQLLEILEREHAEYEYADIED